MSDGSPTLRANPVKAALCAGQHVFGSEISRLRSLEIPRIFARAGFDFVFIDMEHTSFGLETVADFISAARAADIVPIVRVPQAEYSSVARVLDCGAMGLIVPRVNTPEQVRDIVSWMHYPPTGVRGFAATVAQTDDRHVDAQEFIEAAHRETLCVIQIERQEAVDNLDELLQIPGVDVACLGYMDLSVDLQVAGQAEHPRMVAAIERLIDVAEKNNLAAGIIGPDMQLIARWVDRGMRFVSYATDGGLLSEAATAAASRLRALATKPNNDEVNRDARLQRGLA
jgi:2-keto-3-deoxy-L-rhamnonate aldolase RhmA